jgi:hypothetical protein
LLSFFLLCRIKKKLNPCFWLQIFIFASLEKTGAAGNRNHQQPEPGVTRTGYILFQYK